MPVCWMNGSSPMCLARGPAPSIATLPGQNPPFNGPMAAVRVGLLGRRLRGSTLKLTARSSAVRLDLGGGPAPRPGW